MEAEIRALAVRTEATRLMLLQIHQEGGRKVAGHRVTGDMAIMAAGVLETVCNDMARLIDLAALDATRPEA